MWVRPMRLFASWELRDPAAPGPSWPVSIQGRSKALTAVRLGDFKVLPNNEKHHVKLRRFAFLIEILPKGKHKIPISGNKILF